MFVKVCRHVMIIIIKIIIIILLHHSYNNKKYYYYDERRKKKNSEEYSTTNLLLWLLWAFVPYFRIDRCTDATVKTGTKACTQNNSLRCAALKVLETALDRIRHDCRRTAIVLTLRDMKYDHLIDCFV